MHIIPVIDLKAGQVVLGVGGRRSEYRPITSCLTPSSEPIEVVLALIESFKPAELYLADLDAIVGKEPAWAVYQSLRAFGVDLWVDAGVREPMHAIRLAAAGIEGIICGLETLRGPDVLTEILAAIGPTRTIFSLDLHHGQLLGNHEAWSVRDSCDVFALVEAVIACGARQFILLDLARVGENRGTGSVDLCRLIASAHLDVRLFPGGGIRGLDDIAELESAGATGVLVASALHDGRIKPFIQKLRSIS